MLLVLIESFLRFVTGSFIRVILVFALKGPLLTVHSCWSAAVFRFVAVCLYIKLVIEISCCCRYRVPDRRSFLLLLFCTCC